MRRLSIPTTGWKLPCFSPRHGLNARLSGLMATLWGTGTAPEMFSKGQNSPKDMLSGSAGFVDVEWLVIQLPPKAETSGSCQDWVLLVEEHLFFFFSP